MKKTLAVLMAALLACACFATIGSAEDAKITPSSAKITPMFLF